MKAATQRTLRQAMTQLHTWAGLPLGWLLFLIFVSGALSCYQREITLWMQPEMHTARSSEQGIENAMQFLGQNAASVNSWTISLSSERTPYMTVSWRDPQAPQGANPRMAMLRHHIDPASGAELLPRQTNGGGFLYRLHIQFFGVERSTGMAIIGLGTIFMLLALVSGIFVHRTIFKDFFTFRPGRQKISWRDAHNVSAVVLYPFYIIISISGLMLLLNVMMGPVISANYGTDGRSFQMALRGMNVTAQVPRPPEANLQQRAPSEQNSAERAPREGRSRQQENAPAESSEAPLAAILPMVRQAEKIWPQGVSTVVINNPTGPRTTVELRQALKSALGTMSERMVFDGKTGEVSTPPESQALSPMVSLWQALMSLHRAHFAGPLARFLMFASSLGGAAMIGTGLVLWSLSRKKSHNAQGQILLSHRLVESVSIASIPGLLLAIGAFFAASRIIPAETVNRMGLEQHVFFGVWSLSLVYALLRDKKKAWVEQFAVAGILLMLLPLINAFTSGAHLGISLADEIYPLACFDLMALLTGSFFLFGSRKIHRAHIAPDNADTQRLSTASGTERNP